MADLFSAADAKRARDMALVQAEEHADSEWKRAASEAIEEVATKRERFTTDAVWHVLSTDNIPPPHEPRAMGVMMRAALKTKIIEKTGEYRPSVRVACHARPIPVYKSLIHQA